MLLRIGLALILCLTLVLACVAPAQAGVIKAVAAKHKANPNSLHAKAQAKIKDHKAYSGHHPIRHGKKK